MPGQRVPDTDVLLRLMYDNYGFCRSHNGQPLAYRLAVPSVLFGMTELRRRLIREGIALHHRSMSPDALNRVMAIADAYAANEDREPVEPHLRVARQDGLTYLDLGRADGWTVVIGPGWWNATRQPPVRFVRSKLMAPLPMPKPPGEGSLDDVRGWFNITSYDAWALFVACRIASLFPGIVHPVEVLRGPPGAGKSFTLSLMADWIDPGTVPALPVPRDGKQWASMAASKYITPMDNVSVIARWLSDLWCKAVSGDGHVDRALYTDGEIFVAKFRSVIMMSSISVHLREDLADRAIEHHIEPPAVAAHEEVIREGWKASHPSALAWLLDQACAVMAVLPQVPVAGANRLAGFEQIVSAVDLLWGTDAMGAWKAQRRETLQAVAEGDHVAVAITAAVRAPWTGTSTALLDVLVTLGGLGNPEGGEERTWTPELLSRRVERGRGALRALGWTVSKSREPGSGQRLWTIMPPGSGLNGHGGGWAGYGLMEPGESP